MANYLGYPQSQMTGWGGPQMAVATNTASPIAPATTAPVASPNNVLPPTNNPAQLPPVTLPTQYANPQTINQPGQVAPPTGLIGSEQALQGGFNGALNSMNNGAASAEDLLGGTAQQGLDAASIQADLTGANGQQAQQAAQQKISTSPATQYMLDQSQRAIERSAAARGGVLGGNVATALQRNAEGIASQDYQNQFNNLGTVADRGTQLASKIADLRNNLGLNTAQLFTQTGSQMASGRTNAGLAIAQNVSTTANNISNLLNNQGINVSADMGNKINTYANLIHESGMQDMVSNANLAQILANIAGGQASNTANSYNQIGNAQAAGILGTNAAIQNGITQGTQLGAFSSKPTSYSGGAVAGSSASDYSGPAMSSWVANQG